MYPVLFEMFGIRVYSYGTFFLLALVLFFGLVVYEARRRRWKREELVPIALAGFVGGMVGARVSIYFFNGPDTAVQALGFLSLFDPRIGPGSILGAIGGGYRRLYRQPGHRAQGVRV